MTDINININDLVDALNNQVSSLNLELQVAKLHIKALQGKVAELSEDFITPSETTKKRD